MGKERLSKYTKNLLVIDIENNHLLKRNFIENLLKSFFSSGKQVFFEERVLFQFKFRRIQMIKNIIWLFSLVGPVLMLAYIIITRHIIQDSKRAATKPVRVRSDHHYR